jgi:3-methyl-2-oxobutanoate hydroxymethyltransferase
MNVLDFSDRKRTGAPLSMVTCYDYTLARILDRSPVDCILVGDSVAMVVHGFDSTVHASVDMIALHTRAVVRGAPSKFVVADMPFLAMRKGLAPAMETVQTLIQAGAHAVKVEGAAGQLELVHHIVESGVPVMGHLGLTPQSVHALGGHRVQGRDHAAAARIREDAVKLAEAGCFALVLECVPANLAREITARIDIPTIGIGAGAATDGQVLVLQDLLGLSTGLKPKFVRHYCDGATLVGDALERFHEDVATRRYPRCTEAYA